MKLNCLLGHTASYTVIPEKYFMSPEYENCIFEVICETCGISLWFAHWVKIGTESPNFEYPVKINSAMIGSAIWRDEFTHPVYFVEDRE